MNDGSPATLRDLRPGDLGWVIHRQARLYAEEYGWDHSFEGLICEIAAQFVREFRPGLERGWIAERGGEIVGAVFVVRADDETARLRMLYVERSVRGLGLGRQLVDECLRFAKAAGYRRMILWTQDVLVAARRLYRSAGFRCIEEQRHDGFGKPMQSEVWTREL